MANGIIPNNNNSGDILSNAVKIEDGTFIQWGIVPVATSSSTSSAFPYRGEATIAFYEPFTNIPVVLTNIRANAAYWNSESQGATSSTVRISIGGDQNNVTKYIDWIAIGRWK